MKNKLSMISLVFACLALVACATGQRAAREDGPRMEELLHGRWHLAELGMTQFYPGQPDSESLFRPGDDFWLFSYFIELNPDGTFRELNFWTPTFGATGTWTVSGNVLTLVLDGEDGGLALGIPFIGTREFGISPDGGVLTIDYSRKIASFRWDYSAAFTRAPMPAGYGDNRAGPLVGEWELVDIAGVPFEFVLSDRIEFMADGTGNSFINPAHLPPGGAIMPFAVFCEERGMFSDPFVWSSENDKALLEAAILTLFSYEVSGDLLTISYDWWPDSVVIYRRVR